MRQHQRSRGQPLIALGAVLGSWVLVRAAILQSPDAQAAPVIAPTVTQASGPERAMRFAGSIVPPSAIVKADGGPDFPAWLPPRSPFAYNPPPVVPPLHDVQSTGTQPQPMPARIAAGHQLLWLAALSQLPLPPEASGSVAALSSVQRLTPAIYRPQGTPRRWSADGWLLWRRGVGTTASSGLIPASYGGSQIGAVIRYRLAPSSPHRPALYLRASSALRSPRDEEVAVGFVARPLNDLPVVAMAELRATRLASSTALRPAVALVTEFPPIALPLGSRAEVYGQAGYVIGRGATAFADGQVRIDRALVKLGRAELRVGGGAWGGAQDGISRVDVGPSATLGLGLGQTNARLAIDWRFRVAGNAAPASGPAITLSAGF